MEENEKAFETYFSGKMDSAQLNDFHTALKANPELQERYDEFVAIKRATRNIARDNFREQLNDVEIEDDKDDERKTNSAIIITLLKRGAGIAAIFFIAFVTYNLFSTPINVDLFSQNFEVYQPQQTRGHEGYSDILIPYQNADYYEAIVQCAGKSLTPESRMMLANAYIMEGRYSDAEFILSYIDLDSSLRNQVFWYQGLVYIRLNKKQEAINKLNKLQQVSNYKQHEVKELLRSLQ